ncbi:MAG: hypothetical protein GDA45_01500 [Chromatiales bacterium]|nr:hypothetical protein [Chromatiales bacterium]
MAKCNIAEAIPDELLLDIKRDIAELKPASLLIIAIPSINIEPIFQTSDTTTIKSIDDLSHYLNNAPVNRKFDLAIAILTAENIKDDRYMHLISKLRDTDSARVYLACRVNTEIAGEIIDKHYDTCLRGLGFKLLRIYQLQPSDKMQVCLYYYDIYDYKEVPDWLNDRFWANPDMWDKARW